MLQFAINITAVVLSAVATLIIGLVWYSPLVFGNIWLHEIKKSRKDLKRHFGREAVSIFVAAIVIAAVLDIFVKAMGAATPLDGVLVGMAAWLGFRETRHWISFSFGTSSLRLFLLHSFHDLVEFMVMGAILGMMG